VYFDGVAAPMIYSSSGQVSVLVPYAVSGTTKIEVEYLGTKTAALSVPVANAAPGIYGCPGAPLKPVIVQGYLRGAQTSCDAGWSPVKKGSAITLFVTGEGRTTPAMGDGLLPAAGAWPKPAQSVVVKIGGKDVTPDFAGLIYAGVLQINVTVPSDAGSGNVLLAVTVGGVGSQAGAMVAVE